MQFIVTMRQQFLTRSQRLLGRVLALGILLAVPTLGLARLTTDLATFWKGSHAEEALLADHSSERLLALDAPAATLRQHQLRVQSSVSAQGLAKTPATPSLLAEDWRPTAAPVDFTPAINQYMTVLSQTEFISDLWLASAGMPPEVLGLVMNQQIALNQIVNQDLLSISRTIPPNLPMINGFLGNIVLNEFALDNLLVATGVSPNVMSLLLGYQIGFNEAVSQFFLSVVQPTPLTPASPSS